MDELIYFYPEGHQEHHSPGHPERPERIEAVRDALDEKGWWSSFLKLEPCEVPMDVLSGIHPLSYLHLLEEASRVGAWLDGDTYTTQRSYQVALFSAGGAIAVADSVWRGEALRGFALTRLPVTMPDRPEGVDFAC